MSKQDELDAIRHAIDTMNKEAENRSNLYRALIDQQDAIDREIRDEKGEIIWLELPEGLRSIFHKEEGDSTYKIGSYGGDLFLSYQPADYKGDRSDRFNMSFKRERVKDAHELLKIVMKELGLDES